MQPFTQHIEETCCKGNGDYAAYVQACILQRPRTRRASVQNTKHDLISIASHRAGGSDDEVGR